MPEGTLLNGAQVQSLIEVVQATNDGILEYDAAVALLIYSFQFSDAQAKEILGEKKKGGNEDATESETENV